MRCSTEAGAAWGAGRLMGRPHRRRSARLSKVLFLLPSNGFGGAERHTAMFARHLRGIGCDVTIAAEEAVLSRLGAELGAAAALRRAGLGWRESADFRRALDEQCSAAAAILAEERPDIAILPLPWPNFGLGIQRALEDAGTATLVVAHLVPHEIAPEETRFVSDYLRRPESWAWTAVSSPAAARLEAYFGLRPGRVRTLPNAVDVRRLDAPLDVVRARIRTEFGLGPSARIVLFAGRLDRVKGADLLPEICKRLRPDPEITVVCAGEGPLREELDRASARLRNLKVVGYRGDLHHLIAASDVLILPSRLEGWPLVFQEAAALGCPVVASAAALECLGATAARVALIAEGAFAAAIRTGLYNGAVRETLIGVARAHALGYGTADMWAGYVGAMRLVGQ
jgi:glycosyltransferase involved in cell wall biosynthesis